MKYVLISGPNAVGKTTLLNILDKEYDFGIIKEPYTENPFFHPPYIGDNRKFFHSQLFFLIEHYKQHLFQIKNSKRSLIQERSIFDSFEIFGRYFYNNQIITEDEWKLYKGVYELFCDNITKYPDIIIYMKANIGEIVNRIKSRKRENEEVDLNFIKKQIILYEEWINKMSNKSSIIEVDTMKNDIRKNISYIDRLVLEMEK